MKTVIIRTQYPCHLDVHESGINRPFYVNPCMLCFWHVWIKATSIPMRTLRIDWHADKRLNYLLVLRSSSVCVLPSSGDKVQFYFGIPIIYDKLLHLHGVIFGIYYLTYSGSLNISFYGFNIALFRILCLKNGTYSILTVSVFLFSVVTVSLWSGDIVMTF